MREPDGSIRRVQATLLADGTMRFQDRELSPEEFVGAMEDEGVEPGVKVTVNADRAGVDSDTRYGLMRYLRNVRYAAALRYGKTLESMPPPVVTIASIVESDVKASNC